MLDLCDIFFWRMCMRICYVHFCGQPTPHVQNYSICAVTCMNRAASMIGQSSGFTQFSLAQSLSCVQLFMTPWTAACQASLSITNFWSLLKLMSIELVMPSNYLILCHLLSSHLQSFQRTPRIDLLYNGLINQINFLPKGLCLGFSFWGDPG